MCPACASPPGCTVLDRSLDLYWHDVDLAVHFYGGGDGPVVLPVVLRPGCLSVSCLVADPLLLFWFAQPFILLVRVYHVWYCSFVLHYFIMRRVKTLVLVTLGSHAPWRWVTSTLAFNHP
jgi:hypothetical protein